MATYVPRQQRGYKGSENNKWHSGQSRGAREIPRESASGFTGDVSGSFRGTQGRGRGAQGWKRGAQLQERGDREVGSRAQGRGRGAQPAQRGPRKPLEVHINTDDKNSFDDLQNCLLEEPVIFIKQSDFPVETGLNDILDANNTATSVINELQVGRCEKLMSFNDYLYNTICFFIDSKITNDMIFYNYNILNTKSEKIVFALKGGNIYHIYYQYFLKLVKQTEHLTPEQLDVINRFERSFGLSDSDFELLILTNETRRYYEIYSVIAPIIIEALNYISTNFNRLLQNLSTDYENTKATILSEEDIEYKICEITMQDLINIYDNLFELDNLETTNKELYDDIYIKLQYCIQYDGTDTIVMSKTIFFLINIHNYLRVNARTVPQPKLFEIFDKLLKSLSINNSKEINEKIQKLHASCFENLDWKFSIVSKFYVETNINDILTEIHNRLRNIVPNKGEFIYDYTNIGDVTLSSKDSKISADCKGRENDYLSYNIDKGKENNYYSIIGSHTVINRLNVFNLYRIKLNFKIQKCVEHYLDLKRKSEITPERLGITHDTPFNSTTVMQNLKEFFYKPSSIPFDGTLESEFIDISIIDSIHDTSYQHIRRSLMNVSYNSIITELIYQENQNYYDKFNILSMDYMLHDLIKIYCIENIFPWDQKKYTKRIDRVLFMFFMDLRRQFPDFAVFEQNTGILFEIISNLYKIISNLDRVRGSNLDEKTEFINELSVFLNDIFSTSILIILTDENRKNLENLLLKNDYSHNTTQNIIEKERALSDEIYNSSILRVNHQFMGDFKNIIINLILLTYIELFDRSTHIKINIFTIYYKYNNHANIEILNNYIKHEYNLKLTEYFTIFNSKLNFWYNIFLRHGNIINVNNNNIVLKDQNSSSNNNNASSQSHNSQTGGVVLRRRSNRRLNKSNASKAINPKALGNLSVNLRKKLSKKPSITTKIEINRGKISKAKSSKSKKLYTMDSDMRADVKFINKLKFNKLESSIGKNLSNSSYQPYLYNLEDLVYDKEYDNNFKKIMTQSLDKRLLVKKSS